MTHPHQAVSDINLLLEIDYTPFDAACRDPLLTDRRELVLCRRQVKHEGEHATRRGIEAIVWPNTKEKAA